MMTTALSDIGIPGNKCNKRNMTWNGSQDISDSTVTIKSVFTSLLFNSLAGVRWMRTLLLNFSQIVVYDTHVISKASPINDDIAMSMT